MNTFKSRRYKLLLGIVFLIFVICDCALGQADRKEGELNISKAQLVDSFGTIQGDEGSARLNSFMLAINNNPHSLGYVIIYCGKVCKYSEVEAHVEGIEGGLKFSKYDADKIVIISGGFREKTTIEFWVVPEDACPPMPKPTVNIKDVKFQRTRTKISRPYWFCC